MSLTEVFKKRTTCRACGDYGLESILDLGQQYLVNFVDNVDESLPKAPLHLVRCAECGLLQLEHTTNPDLLFKNFWYRTGINQTMRDAMDELVQRGYEFKQQGVWMDIGANDGYLLSKVPSTFKKVAVEPAKNLREDLEKVADVVINDYFQSCDAPQCDVITSAAMFYDVDEPGEFIELIAASLKPTGIWINQLNDAPTMMRTNAFDAICHEHLCYYDIVSLQKLYRKHGLSVLSVSYNDVNGGSMRVVASLNRDGWKSYPTFPKDVVTKDEAHKFAGRVQKWRTTMRNYLDSSPEKAWLYGASTKGCVLLQYLDYDHKFHGIADRNPLKVGKYMTGSWLQVCDEDVMRRANPERIVVLPWAFKNEFVKRERETLDGGSVMVFPLPNIEVVL